MLNKVEFLYLIKPRDFIERLSGPRARPGLACLTEDIPRVLMELDLTIIIPALNEGPNLELLLPDLTKVLDGIGINWEVLVVTREHDTETRLAAERGGARVLNQTEPGYGGALVCGFGEARGRYIITMDADLSHQPTVINDMWRAREKAEVIVASRYVPGGSADMPWGRYLLSRVLNTFFCRGLGLEIHDLSSGYRLYRKRAVARQDFKARDFDVLQEILVRAHAEGWRVAEVPFIYKPRIHGSSHARVFRFGLAYLRTFWSLWSLRNSILAADYDDRAYDSLIPLQRYWQRARFRHLTELIEGEGAVLDVGCGSSRVISALPEGSIGLDILIRKLRYSRKFSPCLVQGSAFGLPFADESFSCVLCSQVIEHIPKEPIILDEICRVVSNGGRLVLGTPDYSRWEWVVTEKLYGLFKPGGYADEHIAHYTRDELIRSLQERGFCIIDTRYIMRGELILAFRKQQQAPETAKFPARAEVDAMPSASTPPSCGVSVH
jgi:dolichol-phosphate mannosyltransferase